MALNPWLVGLVVFGGVDPETGVLSRKNAFQEGFLKVQCLKDGAKIGAETMTRACMYDKQVRRTIGDADNETNLVIRELNDANTVATFNLLIRSYIGDLISAQCTEETRVQPITKDHSLERLQLLANTSTHGAEFFATNGDHATSDDLFKSAKIPVWEAAIKALEDKKVGSALLKQI